MSREKSTVILPPPEKITLQIRGASANLHYLEENEFTTPKLSAQFDHNYLILKPYSSYQQLLISLCITFLDEGWNGKGLA